MRTPEKLTLSKSFCKQRGMSRRSKGGEEQMATRSFVCFSVCLHSGEKKINLCGKKRNWKREWTGNVPRRREGWKLGNWVYSGKRNLWWQKKLERLVLYKPIAGICTTAALENVFQAVLSLFSTNEMEVLDTVLSLCEEFSQFTGGMRIS